MSICRPEYNKRAALTVTERLPCKYRIRAIEILHELEKSPRGVYGGAVGYIDFSGNMDVCIGIRMAMNKGGKVYVRAGAGIVRDSVPASEYNETLIKGQSMISAITDAQEVE